jgi:phage head maturation protease
MKVDNEDVWQKVKAGEVKGFSIEGYFESKEELSKHESILEQIKKILNDAKY